MDKRKKIQEELEAIAPFLAKIDKEEKGEVPFGYFEKLPEEVLRQVRTVASPSAPNSWVDNLITYCQAIFQPRVLAGFSMAVLLVIGSYFMMKPKMSHQNRAMLAELSEEEVSNYIAENIDEFDTDLFYDIDTEALPIDFFEEELNEADFDEIMDDFIEDVDFETLEEIL